MLEMVTCEAYFLRNVWWKSKLKHFRFAAVCLNVRLGSRWTRSSPYSWSLGCSRRSRTWADWSWPASPRRRSSFPTCRSCERRRAWTSRRWGTAPPPGTSQWGPICLRCDMSGGNKRLQINVSFTLNVSLQRTIILLTDLSVDYFGG